MVLNASTFIFGLWLKFILNKIKKYMYDILYNPKISIFTIFNLINFHLYIYLKEISLKNKQKHTFNQI